MEEIKEEEREGEKWEEGGEREKEIENKEERKKNEDKEERTSFGNEVRCGRQWVANCGGMAKGGGGGRYRWENREKGRKKTKKK